MVLQNIVSRIFMLCSLVAHLNADAPIVPSQQWAGSSGKSTDLDLGSLSSGQSALGQYDASFQRDLPFSQGYGAPLPRPDVTYGVPVSTPRPTYGIPRPGLPSKPQLPSLPQPRPTYGAPVPTPAPTYAIPSHSSSHSHDSASQGYVVQFPQLHPTYNVPAPEQRPAYDVPNHQHSVGTHSHRHGSSSHGYETPAPQTHPTYNIPHTTYSIPSQFTSSHGLLQNGCNAQYVENTSSGVDDNETNGFNGFDQNSVTTLGGQNYPGKEGYRY